MIYESTDVSKPNFKPVYNQYQLTGLSDYTKEVKFHTIPAWTPPPFHDLPIEAMFQNTDRNIEIKQMQYKRQMTADNQQLGAKFLLSSLQTEQDWCHTLIYILQYTHRITVTCHFINEEKIKRQTKKNAHHEGRGIFMYMYTIWWFFVQRDEFCSVLF